MPNCNEDQRQPRQLAKTLHPGNAQREGRAMDVKTDKSQLEFGMYGGLGALLRAHWWQTKKQSLDSLLMMMALNSVMILMNLHRMHPQRRSRENTAKL